MVSRSSRTAPGKAPELAKDWVAQDQFLFTYGDILLDQPSDYKNLAEACREDGVIAVKDGEDLTKGGAVVLDNEDFMIDLVEKGSGPAPVNAYYNAGIYIMPPEIFEFTAKLEKSPRGEYEFTDALKAFVKSGARLRGVTLKGGWARCARSVRARGIEQPREGVSRKSWSRPFPSQVD